MALLGHRTRSMFDPYNTISTQDLGRSRAESRTPTIAIAIPGDQLQVGYGARGNLVELNGIEPSTS